jgi:AcrR family transcriptional regulator
LSRLRVLVYNEPMPYPSQINRETILKAAQGKLEKKGEIGLRHLAKELGVQAPSLYRYFPSQKALEKAVAVEGFRQLGLELQKAVDKDASYHSISYAYRNFALGHPRLYNFMHDPDVVLDRHQEVVAFLLDPIAKGLGIDFNDRKVKDKFVFTLRNLRSYLHGFVSLEMAGHFILGGDANKSFETGLKLIYDALQKYPPKRG